LLGDDYLEVRHSIDASHDLIQVLWFCVSHQQVWETEETLVLETTRVVSVVQRTASGLGGMGR
jgi:hypothetical protein